LPLIVEQSGEVQAVRVIDLVARVNSGSVGKRLRRLAGDRPKVVFVGSPYAARSWL